MQRGMRAVLAILGLILIGPFASTASAQVPPSSADRAGYTGLHHTALHGNLEVLRTQLIAGMDVDARDGYGRTPLHVAAYQGHHEAMRLLVAAGADPNALERDFYDIVTIASVADDVATLRVALELGGSAGNVTSRYDGTALIAAAHLGHVEVVETLIAAGAPLDHVNNLRWTALIESIVLGDGGLRHTATLTALVQAGADVNLPDGRGQTPLTLARSRGYQTMAAILEAAGAR